MLGHGHTATWCTVTCRGPVAITRIAAIAVTTAMKYSPPAKRALILQPTDRDWTDHTAEIAHRVDERDSRRRHRYG